MLSFATHSGAMDQSWPNWDRLRYKIVPVEVLFILFCFLMMLHPQLYTQLFFQRIAQDAIASSNSTLLSHQCLNQDLVVNYTSSATFEKVQRTANRYNMYCEIISLGTGSLVALIYGPLSDIIGRKPILVIGFTGILLAGVVQLCIVVFELNLYFNLLSVGMFGLGGGSATMTGIAFASVSDVTPKKWLAARMSVVESAIPIGTTMSFLIGYNWLQSDHCNFLPPVILMISTSVFCLLYLVIFPEPLSKNKSEQTPNESRGFTKLLNGIKLFFIPSYIGYFNWWRVWIICIVICLESLCEIGSNEIINYFLYNKPLEWSYRLISFYGTYFSIMNAVSLLILCPVLIALKFPKYLIIFIPIVAAVLCNVATGFVRKTWEMFVVGGFLCIRDMGFPVLRAMLASHVNPKIFGSVLTLSSAFECITSSGSSVLFNEVYHPEAVVNGHNINAGVIFWISAGIWALNIPLVMILWYFGKPKNVRNILSADKRSLLTTGTRSVIYDSNYGSVNR